MPPFSPRVMRILRELEIDPAGPALRALAADPSRMALLPNCHERTINEVRDAFSLPRVTKADVQRWIDQQTRGRPWRRCKEVPRARP